MQAYTPQQSSVTEVGEPSHVRSMAVSPMTERDVEVTKPKRPLTAFNYFFQLERQKILDSIAEQAGHVPSGSRWGKGHGKISFANLARLVSARWRQTEEEGRHMYYELAAADKERYKKEKRAFKRHQRSVKKLEDAPVKKDSFDQAPATYDRQVVSMYGPTKPCYAFFLPVVDPILLEPLQPSTSCTTPSAENLANCLGDDGVETFIRMFR